MVSGRFVFDDTRSNKSLAAVQRKGREGGENQEIFECF